MKQENTSKVCPVCDAAELRPESKSAVDEKGRTRNYSRCLQCGALTLMPPIPEEELATYYEAEYYSPRDSKFPPVFENAIQWFRNRKAGKIAQVVDAPSPRRVLDIGCGSGDFLQSIQQVGFKIYGIELPGPAAERARVRPDLHLHIGAFDDYPAPQEPFDLITMWHVLEHMPDPRGTIERCYSLLAPGGQIAIDVPNGDSWQARWFGPLWLHRDPPRHLIEFTSSSLSHLLAQAGFKDIRMSAMQQEMGWFGMIQSIGNLLMQPRDSLYNLIRSRGSVPEPKFKKLQALLLGGLFALPALLITCAESVANKGAVVRVIAQKPAEVPSA